MLQCLTLQQSGPANRGRALHRQGCVVSQQRTQASGGGSVAWQQQLECLTQGGASRVQHNTVQFNKAFGCSKRAPWPVALEVLRDFACAGLKLDAASYGRAATLRSKKRLWVAAVDTLERASLCGLQGNTFLLNMYITALERGRSWAATLKTLAQMGGASLRCDIVSVNAVTAAFGPPAAAVWRVALDFFRKVPAQLLAADIATCNTLIDDLLGASMTLWRQGLQQLLETRRFGLRLTAITQVVSAATRWQLALEMGCRFSQAGLQNNIISINAAMGSCQRACEDAVGLWRIVVADLSKAEDSADVDPDAFTYSTSLAALQAGGAPWKGSLLLLAQVRHRKTGQTDRGAQVAAWNAGASSCATRAAWEAALGLLLTAGSVRISPDDTTLNVALGSCRRAAVWQQAVGVFGVASSALLETDSLSVLEAVSAQEVGATWQASVTALQQAEWRNIRLQSETFGAACTVCARGERWQEAGAILTCLGARSLENNMIAQNAAMSGCASRSDWVVGLALATRMYSYGSDVKSAAGTSTVNIALHAQDVGGRWQQAAELLFRDLFMPGCQRDFISLNAATSSFISPDCSWQRILALTNVAICAGLLPDPINQGLVLSACGRGRDWRVSLALLEDVCRSRLKPQAADAYLPALEACEAGSGNLAVPVAGVLLNDLPASAVGLLSDFA
eukprot:TRINITY_DN19897_c0_g1_i1.p1 TRINITY_DN19897_c0_g1~~TRINITY_DN19897_c0_g1_i1.p1  ORF type:complete len:679 (+),score=117.94 TRINITY_DN19897_c0_g1_i1:210-2246(+)